MAVALLLIIPAGWAHSRRALARQAGGVAWETAQQLAITAFRPVIAAAPNGTLMVMYNKTVAGETENPYYQVSLNGGASWSSATAVRNSAADLNQVNLAFGGDSQAHAIWLSDDQVLHARQDQWPGGQNVIADAGGERVQDPDIAVAPDGSLHVVWAQDSGPSNLYAIHHAYSKNGGTNWTHSLPLSTAESHHSIAPVIAITEDGNVHVAWEESSFDSSLPDSFRYEIHYKKGVVSGSGINWDSQPTIISGALTKARRPSLLADGSNLHAAFANQASSDEQYAYYAPYSPGSGWSTPLDVTRGHPVSVNVNTPFFLIIGLGACSDGVSLYYHGSEVANAAEQIWGASSRSAWHNQEEVTGGQTRVIHPAFVCQGGYHHLVYEEIVNPNIDHHIYFMKGIPQHGSFLPLLSGN